MYDLTLCVIVGRMTVTAEHASPSRMIAAEVRAEVARQGSSLRKLAMRMGVSHTWVTRRVSFGADVDLTFEDVDKFAAGLGVPTTKLIAASAWLPRLDSNQQPSGYPFPLVRGVPGSPHFRSRTAPTGILAAV